MPTGSTLKSKVSDLLGKVIPGVSGFTATITYESDTQTASVTFTNFPAKHNFDIMTQTNDSGDVTTVPTEVWITEQLSDRTLSNTEGVIGLVDPLIAGGNFGFGDDGPDLNYEKLKSRMRVLTESKLKEARVKAIPRFQDKISGVTVD